MSDVEILGLDATLVALEKQLAAIEANGQTLIEETVINTDADIKTGITDQGMVDTGRYRSSWQPKIGTLEATESSNVEYGPFLEYGTVKMRARPHVRPAFEKNRKKFIQGGKEIMK